MEPKPHENPVRKQPPASLRIEPADTLILDFQHPEFWISIILATQPVVLCSGSPNKLIQTLSNILRNLETTETKMVTVIISGCKNYGWLQPPFYILWLKTKQNHDCGIWSRKHLGTMSTKAHLLSALPGTPPPGKSHRSCSLTFSRPSVTWHLTEVRTEDFLRGGISLNGIP